MAREARQANAFLLAQGMDVSCSDSSVRVHTPAKLNLFLEVKARREDSYRETETLITAFTICDTYCHAVPISGFDCHVNGQTLCSAPQKDLLLGAENTTDV